jgi:glycosyltransferase involved in cell wall biosynthesis
MKEIGRILPIPRAYKVYIQMAIIKFFAGTNLVKPKNRFGLEFFSSEFSAGKQSLTIIDGQSLNGPDFYRGIGRYTLKFTRALATSYPHRNFLILISNVRMDEFTEALISEVSCSEIQNLKITIVDIFENSSITSLDLAEKTLNSAVKKLNCEFLIIPSFFSDNREVFPIDPPKTSQQVGILHDLIPLSFQKEYLASARSKKIYYKNLQRLRNSNHILSVSHFSAKDYTNHFGINENLIVIGGASIFEKSFPEKGVFENRYGVLCIAGSGVSKNIESFVRAYCKLPRELRGKHPLCLTGNLNYKQLIIFQLVARLSRSTINFRGFVTDTELEQIYRMSRVLVIPSLAEGLALPVYEMWSNGGVVLGGRNTAVHETINCDQAVFDVENFLDFEKLLSKTLTDNDYWSYLQAEGQMTMSSKTWSKVAERVSGIFN